MKLYLKQDRRDLKDLRTVNAPPTPKTRLEELRESIRHNDCRRAYYELIQTDWYFREQENIRAKMFKLSEQLRIMANQRADAVAVLAEVDRIGAALQTAYDEELKKSYEKAAETRRHGKPKASTAPKVPEFAVQALMRANNWTREQAIAVLTERK